MAPPLVDRRSQFLRHISSVASDRLNTLYSVYSNVLSLYEFLSLNQCAQYNISKEKDYYIMSFVSWKQAISVFQLGLFLRALHPARTGLHPAR